MKGWRLFLIAALISLSSAAMVPQIGGSAQGRNPGTAQRPVLLDHAISATGAGAAGLVFSGILYGIFGPGSPFIPTLCISGFVCLIGTCITVGSLLDVDYYIGQICHCHDSNAREEATPSEATIPANMILGRDPPPDPDTQDIPIAGQPNVEDKGSTEHCNGLIEVSED